MKNNMQMNKVVVMTMEIIMMIIKEWQKKKTIKLKYNQITFKLKKCSEKIKSINVSLPYKPYTILPPINNLKIGKLKYSTSSFKSIANKIMYLKLNKHYKEYLNSIKNRNTLKTLLNRLSSLLNHFLLKALTKINNLFMDLSVNLIILEK